MKCYLAGWQSGNGPRERRLIDAGVTPDRCFSFANLVKQAGFPWYLPGVAAGYGVCLDRATGIMMDSGCYSLRTYRKYLTRIGKSAAEIPTEKAFLLSYVDYAREFGHLWDFAVTVDFSYDSAANYARQIKLDRMGVVLAPVYHGDSELDYLRKYADLGHKLICIANMRKIRTAGSTSKMRRYLDSCFELAEKLGVGFHGLAMTSPWIILGYPWRSVDSSSWSRVAGFGSIMHWDEHTGRMTTLHVSKRNSASAKLHGSRHAMDCVRAHVEAAGYDFEKLRRNLIYRHQWNAATMLKLVTAATQRQQGHGYGWRHLV